MFKKYNYKKTNSLFNTSERSLDAARNSIGRVVFKDEGNSIQRFRGAAVEREDVLDALESNSYEDLVTFSRHFYRTNIMYARMIDFLADAYFYYWTVFPNGRKSKDYDIDKWWDALEYIETFNPEKFGPELARKVLVNGSVYIYIKDKITGKDIEIGLQELDANYCAVRSSMNGISTVTFNLKYFDQFRDLEKTIELASFPKEISDAYIKYDAKSTKVRGEEWFDLDTKKAFMFSIRDDEIPYLIPVLLDLIDHDSVKTLNMVKLEQELSKLLVQAFKVSNDGTPSVDMVEMLNLHKNLVDVAGDVPGVDVATTLGEIKSIDIQKDVGVAANHPVTKSKENIYSTASMPQQIFNTESVGGMKYSLAREMGSVAKLTEQLQEVINVRLKDLFKKKDTNLKIDILSVNRYNQAEMIGYYKEQTTIGFSKFLPAVAVGQRQSTIMSALEFEDAIELRELMNPPQSSSTLSSKDNGVGSNNKTAGAPEKKDEDRSEKTEQNRESITD